MNGTKVGTVENITKRPPELTWQAIMGSFVVASIVAATYPFIVLKIGFGPNVSVVGAFFGAIFLGVVARRTRGRNFLQNNLIQTATTSAAMTAFMCVVAAAFHYLSEHPTSTERFSVPPFQMFVWLTISGWIGVLFTTFFRRTYLDDERMKFADGIAAAETVRTLDARGGDSRQKVAWLGLTGATSAILTWFRDARALIPQLHVAGGYRISFEANLLYIGSGMLVGLRIALSMLAGSILVWLVIGPWLVESGIALDIVLRGVAAEHVETCRQLAQSGGTMIDACAPIGGYLKGSYYSIIVKWAMWPATALMLTNALTDLAFQWRAIGRAFQFRRTSNREATVADVTEQDISPRVALRLGGLLCLVLAFVQHAYFGASITQTLVAAAGSLVLMLVGTRVLGETNQGPVSLMANGLQAFFAVFWKNQAVLNLVAAGTAGNISAQSEGLMQDFRAGRILGSSPRLMTWFQFWAVPIGAAAVAIMYPILVGAYGIGGEAGLSAPTGLKLANMALILRDGISALPPGALRWTIIAAIAGVGLALIQRAVAVHDERTSGDARKWSPWLPSAGSFGFALILPGELNIMMAIGGIIAWTWKRVAEAHYNRYMTVVASGFIVGDAMIGGVLYPALLLLGVVTQS